jgi:hypothetical protein
MAAINSKKKDIGQSMVEFAISAIVILMLLVAVADLGRAFFTYLSIRDAAQEGAVFGAVCPQHVTQIFDRVQRTSQTPVDLNDPAHVQITCDYISYDIYGNASETPCDPNITPLAGHGIKIGVTFNNFTVTTPLAGSLLGQTLTLRAEVTDTIIRVPELSEWTCQ